MRIRILLVHAALAAIAGAWLVASAVTRSGREEPATYGRIALHAGPSNLEGWERQEGHAHDHAPEQASLAASVASTCDKDIDTTGVIGGLTFIAAQDNGICTNGDLDAYWLGGQLYIVQSGGMDAGFTISRINADGTPSLIAQRSWTQPNTNTADVQGFKQGGRQYVSFALESYGVGGACGIVIIDVTDAPDITAADTVAQITGPGWCSVHNNFVESIGGE